jgi:hypothetical protein
MTLGKCPACSEKRVHSDEEFNFYHGTPKVIGFNNNPIRKDKTKEDTGCDTK